MSETGLEIFDRTIQTTHRWLNEIGERIGPEKQHQYRALRAVLFALRDRLTTEEAFHLSSQLPLLIRGIYWETYRPTDAPEKIRSREAFLGKVAENLETDGPVDPQEAAEAVFGVLARHIPEGEMAHVIHMLPDEVRSLFPAA